MASFETRADVLPEPTLRTLYVSPSGDDGNPGTSPGAPLRTIQHAADLSQPGDLVLIQPGVYRASCGGWRRVTTRFRPSGRPSARS